MRGSLRSMVGTAIMFAAMPASAQRYDPSYPVCMEIADGEGSRIECFFTSMEQCREGAKGMPGTCFTNPYYKPSAAPAADVAPEPAPAPTPTPAKKKKR